MILNHLDLYVPDVAATRTFFEQHFGLRHQATRGAGRLAVLYDDAGLERGGRWPPACGAVRSVVVVVDVPYADSICALLF